jgi:hypothetical protein
MTSKDPKMTQKSPSRSLKETASDTAAMSGLFILLITLLAFLSAGTEENGVRALKWAANAGELLYGQLGWTLSIYITVLLGFYAASIGGQILGGQESADGTRRLLGFIAELMAAATVCLVLFIVLYCSQEPSQWPILVVLIPVVGIVIFLAMQLGNFVVPERDIQIALAEKTRDLTGAKLIEVRKRSRRSFFLVWGANSAVIGLLTFVTALPTGAGGILETLLVGLCFIGWVALLLIAHAISLHSLLAWSDRTSRIITGVITPILMYVAFLAVLVLGASGDLGLPIRFRWALVIFVIGSAATTYWPRSYAPPWILNWSMQGVSAKWAARSLAYERARAVRKYLRLKAERSKPTAMTGEPNLLRRLMVALKAPASES